MLAQSPAQLAQPNFDELFKRWQRPLLLHLKRLVSDPLVAEDLCQETFLKAFRAWARLEPGTNYTAWLYRIATNTAYDHLRRRRRISWQRIEPDDHRLIATADRPEQNYSIREPVETTLQALPEFYRLPLMLYNGGYSISEIGKALGIPAGTVKTRLHRARARFRQLYPG